MNRAGRTVYPILLMVCATHLLNDMMQSVIPAVYPLLKEEIRLRLPRSASSRWFSNSPRRFCNLSPGGWPTSSAALFAGRGDVFHAVRTACARRRSRLRPDFWCRSD